MSWSPLALGNYLSSGLGAVPANSSATQPLILASSYPPVPAKLVEKIKAGKYVDMKEMMADNIALLHSLEAFHPAVQAGLQISSAHKPHMREVSDILTWTYCFLAYVAVHTPDQKTRDMLTYARLLIREARKHGGDGWKAYDAVFRENAAVAPTTDWTKLESSLHATTFVANRSSEGTACHYCSESDHVADDCAAAFLKQGHCKKPTETSLKPTPPRSEEGRGSRWLAKTKSPQTQRLTPYTAPYRNTPGNICHSWNYTRCVFPNRCRLQHICALCFVRGGWHKEHPARECPDNVQQWEQQNIPRSLPRSQP